MSFLMRTSRSTAYVCRSCRIARPTSHYRYYASTVLDSKTISEITAKEKQITGQAQPVRGGPTAQAQKHAGEQLNPQNISDITKGEKKITGQDQPVRGGPTSAAQSMLSGDQGGSTTTSTSASGVSPSSSSSSSGAARNASNSNGSNSNSSPASGVLDSATISKITAAEKQITGSDNPAKGGPTAQAQKHAGEPITSEALSDITAGEKKVAGDRVRGGPTSTVQSELGRSRN